MNMGGGVSTHRSAGYHLS